MRSFSGHGGGSGQKAQAQPVNTRDNLRSADRVEMVLGLCEGPIKGLYEDSNTNFRIGDTRLQNSDGTLNFPLFKLDIGVGETPGEVITPVLGGYEDYRKFDRSLSAGTEEVFVTSGKGLQQIVLRLQVDKLYVRGTQTNLPPGVAAVETDLPNTMQFEIYYRPENGGSWVNPIGGVGAGTFSITGNTRTGQIHEIRFLTDVFDDQMRLSVKLLTPDSERSACQVKLQGLYEVTPGVFGSTKSTSVGTALAPTLPVTRSTDYPPRRKDGSYGIDVIDIRVAVDALYFQDTSGIYEEEVRFLVEAKPSSSSSWQRPFQSASSPSGEIVIRDKTTSPTIFEIRFPVTPIEEPYDVRLTRTSPDDSGAGRVRVIRWESMQEIVGGPLQFDGVATAHIVGEITDQLSSIPDLWGVYDALVMRVPTNYDPYSRTYVGVWDGTWKLDWSNNAAFALHECVMNEVWGVKKYRPNVNMDRYEVYECATYCDAMVPDGKGGLHPRYTFNAVISDAKPGKEFLRYMAGTFNATTIDNLNGDIRLKMALPERHPVALFTAENIIGMFEYSSTDMVSQYNHVTVAFDNHELDFETDFRIVYDQDHIDRFGKIPLEIAAFGCTNAQEAIRRAVYRLITATTEDCLLTFQTNRLGLFIEPFDVILIADADMDYGMSSRISNLEGRLVRLHEPVFLEPGINYSATFTTVSGGNLTTVTIPIVADISGTTYIFSLADDPPALPEDAVVSIGATDAASGNPQPFMVIDIEDGESPEVCKITAGNVNRLKQQIADNATDRFGLDLLNYPSDIAAPTGLRVTTETILVNDEVVPVLVIMFTASEDPRAVRHEVQTKRAGAPDSEWTTVGNTRVGRVDVLHVANGAYDVRVRALAFGGRMSPWAVITDQNAGLDVPPADVSGFFATLIGSSFQLSWFTVPDRDLSHYTIRFVPDDVTGEPSVLWGQSIEVVSATKTTSVRVPALVGKYLIKAVDLSGRESENPAFCDGSSTGFGLNAVMEIDATYPFSTGTKENVSYDATSLLLKLDPDESEGSYTVETGPLGASGVEATTCRITVYPYLSAERSDFMMSDWATLAGVPTLSGVEPGTWEVELQIDCHDGVGWRLFAPGDWSGTQFSLRTIIRRFQDNVTPVISRVRWLIDTPDRTERGSVVVSSTTSVLFNRPFLDVPVLSATIRNQTTGDYLEITKDEFGFEITARDSTGTAVTRQIDWIAVGYGGS